MLGLFGGTFNPIHLGHSRMALAAARTAAVSQLLFIPSALPPHRKQPDVSAHDRLHMVRLALTDMPHCQACDIELQRQQPSYTVDTLQQLQAHYQQPLVFFIGADSLLQFHRWHRFEHILRLCHLLVMPRPGFTVTPDKLHSLLANRLTREPSAMHTQPAGTIVLLNLPCQNIAATQLRQWLASGDYQQAGQWLHPAVLTYIRERGLYRQQPFNATMPTR